MISKTFGLKETGVKYAQRIGAYGIGLDREGRLPLIEIPMGFFLLGGGIEKGETGPECLVRECLEEAGMEVRVGEFMGTADLYQWSDFLGRHIHRIGHFYIMEPGEIIAPPIETDHKLHRLEPKEAVKVLTFKHQAYGVESFIKAME